MYIVVWRGRQILYSMTKTYRMPAFRSPYDSAMGLVFLPRLIDKMRASGTAALDGYNYKTAGMDAVLLEFLAVDADAMEAAAKAGTDAEVFVWVSNNARKWTREEAISLNHAILDSGQRSDDERASFEARRLQRYPDRPLQYFVDLIESDAGRPIRARPLPDRCYDPEDV
jgi:hypothetical protein